MGEEGEEDSGASLPKFALLLLKEGADGADAGASAGAGYDIAINMFGTNANIF
jgi:hypothetical protein